MIRSNQRKFPNAWCRMSRGADEVRVLVVGDRKPADEKFAQPHTMHRPLVRLAVGGAPEELARRNPRQMRNGGKRRRAFHRDILSVGGHDFFEKASIVQESWALSATSLSSI